MIYCKNCGKQLADGAAFCSECGTRVEQNKPVDAITMKKIKKKKPIYKRWWFWVIAVLLGIGFLPSNGDAGKEVDILDAETHSEESYSTSLAFLDGFTEYGYTVEQIAEMRTVLQNVGITDITELDIQPVVSGMQVIQGVAFEDKVVGKEVRVTFNIENGVIYLVCIYCPSRYTANQPPYLSGLKDRRADLYYDVNGGYLKKIDWENKSVIDY